MFVGKAHRHLNNIDCLMAHPTGLVCFISTVNDHIKKKPWKPSTSSGHLTNLKQSIFHLLISMVRPESAIDRST